MSKKRKSLYSEIIEYLNQYLKDSDTDGHFKQGVLSSNRSAAQYAIRNIIGHIVSIKESRDLDKIKPRKKK